MTTITKRVLAIALTGALLAPAISTAEAGPRHGWNDHRGGWNDHRGGWDRHQPRRHQGGHKKKKNNDVGAAVAAGIIGLAAGAILLGATNQRSYAQPAPSYYPPAPYPGRVSGTGYQPCGAPRRRRQRLAERHDALLRPARGGGQAPHHRDGGQHLRSVHPQRQRDHPQLAVQPVPERRLQAAQTRGDQGLSRPVRHRSEPRQNCAVRRRLQPLQTGPIRAKPRIRRRNCEIQHHADRPHRVWENDDGPNIGSHAQRALRYG